MEFRHLNSVCSNYSYISQVLFYFSIKLLKKYRNPKLHASFTLEGVCFGLFLQLFLSILFLTTIWIFDNSPENVYLNFCCLFVGNWLICWQSMNKTKDLAWICGPKNFEKNKTFWKTKETKLQLYQTVFSDKYFMSPLGLSIFKHKTLSCSYYVSVCYM